MENISHNNKIKRWEDLTLANNFMFYKVMSSDTELCRELLERLLHFKIEKVIIQNERIIESDVGGKSIRLDVYAAENGKVYDLEMQTTNPKDLSERSRYYQSLMDVDCLDSGEPYRNLPENYVIFICLEDPFKKGLPCYTFTNRCHEIPNLELNDRTYKLFYNASSYTAEKDAKVREVLKFFATNKSEGTFTKDLQTRVSSALKNAQWRHSYMTWERYGNYQKEEGFEAGAQNAKLQTARNMLIENLGTMEQIARVSNLPLETVLQLQTELQAVPAK